MNVHAVMDASLESGIPHQAELLAYAEHVTRKSEHVSQAREALASVSSAELMLDAAGIVAVFNGLVRCADLSGIPLDASTQKQSEQFRAELGLNHFPGAKNSDLFCEAPTRP